MKLQTHNGAFLLTDLTMQNYSLKIKPDDY